MEAVSNEIKERYEAWWQNKNTEPIVYIIYPDKSVDFSAVKKEWMAEGVVGEWTNWRHENLFGHAVQLIHKTGNYKYLDDAILYFKRYAEATKYIGDGYRFLMPNLGPGCTPTFATGFAEFKDITIWVELHEPWDWDKILDLTGQDSSAYAEIAIEAVRRLCEEVQDSFVISSPDLGGIMDNIAAVRGTNNLLIDTLDEPQNIMRAITIFEKLWNYYNDKFTDIINKNNHGCYVRQMRYLSSKPVITGVCDFSAMISPVQFEEFVLPTIKKQCDDFDGRMVFHLDGPGELPHVPKLLSIENLHAIQWVPGAGNEDTLSEKHYPLYKQIIEGGKKIALGGCPYDLDGVKKLLKTFPKEAFLIPASVESEDEAKDFLSAVGR